MCSLSHAFVPSCVVAMLREAEEVKSTVYCCPKLTFIVSAIELIRFSLGADLEYVHFA